MSMPDGVDKNNVYVPTGLYKVRLRFFISALLLLYVSISTHVRRVINHIWQSGG